MFKSPFSFEGRIRRTEYGISYLGYVLIAVGLNLYVESSPGIGVYFLILYIPMLWFLVSQGAKRCHDLGNSGWFQLIPFYGFWMLFANSQFGPNKYGDNPKGEGNTDEIDVIGTS